jgi:hypothetical protein
MFKSHPDYILLEKALHNISNSITRIKEVRRQQENQENMNRIAKSLVGSPPVRPYLQLTGSFYT